MTPRAKRPSPAAAAAPAFVPPYPPSWVDRLTAWVDRLPAPPWAFYLALAAFLTSLLMLAARAAGDYRPGPFLPFHIWTAGQLAYMLALMHYLDRSAGTALDSFRSVLDGPKRAETSAFADLRYRLTTLPRGPARLASVAGAVFGISLPFLFLGPQAFDLKSWSEALSLFGFSDTSRSFAGFIVAYFIPVEAVSGALVYHTIHQLRLIGQIYASQTRLSLYRLQPLYALSVPCAITSAGLVLYTYAWFAAAPALLEAPISRVLGVFFTAIAAMTFAWPLLGIHRRLVAEKKRLLAASAERFEATVAELHHRVDRRRLKTMDDLNKTLSSLELEQAALRRVPTWPWEPGTLRGVIAALGLPIIIWLIQFGLDRWLGA